MHLFEQIYLWIMVVGSACAVLIGVLTVGKETKVVNTPGRFLVSLIANAVFVFWALEIVGKL